MDFDQLARHLDQTYTDCYASGREEGLEDFGRKHSADIATALADGRTLEDLVTQANIAPPSYWGEKVGRGMDVRDRLMSSNDE